MDKDITQMQDTAQNKFSKFLTRKNIFIVFGLIVILELIWASWTLFKPAPPQVATKQAPAEEKPTIVSLSSPKTTLKVGEDVTVYINISSDKRADGVDLIINYDPKLLSPKTTDGQPVIAGTIFTDYPQNVLDAKLGRITVSGITAQAGGIIPNGLFGSLVFVAKAPGAAKVSLEFTPQSTIDSNVTETNSGKDVLEKVNNLELNILP